MKYEFHVGDYVETKDGRVGYITKICHCEFCKDRGFYEPYVRYNDGEEEYITVHEVEHFQDFYNRIGQYDFTKPKQSKEIERLPDDLPARFELPNGKAMNESMCGQLRILKKREVIIIKQYLFKMIFMTMRWQIRCLFMLCM